MFAITRIVVFLHIFSQVFSLESLSGLDLSIYGNVVSNIKCSCKRRSDYDVSKINVNVKNYETGTSNSYLIGEAADGIKSDENFEPQQCITIFILGFNTPIESEVGKSVQCIFSKIKCLGKNVLEIIIDPYQYTKGGPTPLQNIDAYKEAVKYVKSSGIAIGKFIAELIKEVDIENIYVIGHSLGGHMGGYAGYYLKEQGTQLCSVYAADSAGPCYKDCIAEHVQSGQAKVVYSFHTTQTLGTTQTDLADYDFISNDGKHQKGCGLDIGVGMKENRCSHDISTVITTSPAVKNKILHAKKCESYEDFKNKKCDENESTYAGFMVNVTGSPGKYYFTPPSDLICNFIFN